MRSASASAEPRLAIDSAKAVRRPDFSAASIQNAHAFSGSAARPKW